MNSETLISLTIFIAAAIITPGPNNLMLMTSGTNYGFKKTIPHMLGVVLGYSFMVVVIGLGLATFFKKFPESYTALKVFSVVYILWLAWKIIKSTPAKNQPEDTISRPMTFLQAAMFQWVNPKGWSMGISTIAIFSADNKIETVFLISLIYAAVNFPSVAAWTALGQNLRRWLSSPTRLKIFNWTMALLLLGSLAPML